MPCKFSKILEQNFSYYTDKVLSLHKYVISQNLKVCQKYKYLTVNKTHHSHRGTYSKVQMCQISRKILSKSHQECQNVTIEFCFIMRIFYELRYTVIIKIVWTFYLKSVPAKFQKSSKHISWVISGTSSSKLSCNPRHPSRNISCNHRHNLLQPSWQRIFCTSNYQKTRVDSDINSDYKASSFDKLYIRRRKWDTAGFVRAHQRKYWNALTVGRGHADNGCSCNHRAVPAVFLRVRSLICVVLLSS